MNPGQPTSAQTVQPETLAEISVSMADAPAQVFFNAGEILHPFGFPTPYRRMWMKSLGQKMESEGFPPPPEFRGITLSEDDFVALLTTTRISLDDYTGVIEHDVDDQVVVVRAGTPLLELQYELGKVGQCIPIPTLEPPQAMATATIYAPLIDEIGYNLPHGLFGQCGSWRDWILGMKVVQPDGTVVKCGSKAVKNVAGYDVQKLMIGARGTLGLIANRFPPRSLKFGSTDCESEPLGGLFGGIPPSGQNHPAMKPSAMKPKAAPIHLRLDNSPPVGHKPCPIDNNQP